jgi:hypothetical protein
MNRDSKAVAAVGVAAVGGLLAAFFAGGSSQGASRGGPTATVGPGSLRQHRPVPAWSDLSTAGQGAYVNVLAQQLGVLGCPVDNAAAVTDPQDASLDAAIQCFLRDEAPRARGYGYVGGFPLVGDDIVAVIKAVDDTIHDTGADASAPDAPDYRPPVAGSAGLAAARGRAAPAGVDPSGCGGPACGVDPAPAPPERLPLPAPGGVRPAPVPPLLRAATMYQYPSAVPQPLPLSAVARAQGARPSGGT